MKLKRKNLVWIFRKKAEKVASTYMRGYQLSELIKSRINNFDITYTNEDNLELIKDSIVFLTKGFLKDVSEEELLKLKSGNNIICVDFVDDPEKEAIVEIIDVLIASSISQSIYYKNQYPNKYTHIITHHTDPDIPLISLEPKDVKIGYFGELLNAKWNNELSSQVDFILTNTKTRSRDWIEHLKRYNFHYAVRQRRDIDGFKPFLKGFTAAKCGACIIVPEFESDSRYYLSNDYPYLLKNDDLNSALNMIEFVKSSYMKQDWKIAKEIMADVHFRSTDDYIAGEVNRLITSL